MEKYGFVYIWYDKKHKRYYIGSHWGTENDGYVCSSTWMRNSYNRRPQDFKRRILQTNLCSTQTTWDAEQKWLLYIKENELGARYYNRCRQVPRSNGKNRTGISEETREKMRQAKLGKSPINKGKTLEEQFGNEKAAEVRSKLAKSHLGQEAWNKGKEYIQIQGENHWTKKQGGHKPETIEKIRQAKIGKYMLKTRGENHWTKHKKDITLCPST